MLSGWLSALAKIQFSGIDEYSKKLAALGGSIEGVCRYALYDAAGMVADEIKAAVPVGKDERSSGDLRDSVAITKMVSENGTVYTKIIFDGYDRKGVPNALKASVLESGRSDMKKTPFVRPTVNRVKGAAEFLIAKALEEKINELMK